MHASIVTRRTILCAAQIAVVHAALAATAMAGSLIGIVAADLGTGLAPGPFVGDSGIGSAPPTMIEIPGTGVLTPDPNHTWTKNIVWDYSSSSLSPGDRLCIRELIHIFNPPGPTGAFVLADWHEDLIGGDVPLEWEADTATIAARIGATPIPINPSVETSDDGRSIWFKFDPLTPLPIDSPLATPIVLDITKYVVYTGASVITSGGTTAAITFQIREQPSTPEPGSGVLASVGLSVAASCRRRKR